MKPQIIDRFVYVKGKKISEVENTGTLHGKELIPVADNNQNFHTTVDLISDYVDNSHDYLTTEDYNDLKGQIDSERINRQEADNELNQSIQDTKSELHSTISNVESELLNEVSDLQGLIDNINDTGIANGVTLDTVLTITGKKTFTTVPKSTADATEDTDLVNKKYVDDAVANVDVDLDGYATQAWVNEQGFAKTSDIPEGLEIGETTGTAFDGGRGKEIETVIERLYTKGYDCYVAAGSKNDFIEFTPNPNYVGVRYYTRNLNEDIPNVYDTRVSIDAATASNAGVMSAADKKKLDSIPTLTTSGDGTKYLSDNGAYKTITQLDPSNYVDNDTFNESITQLGSTITNEVTTLEKKDAELLSSIETINESITQLDDRYLPLSGGTINGNVVVNKGLTGTGYGLFKIESNSSGLLLINYDSRNGAYFSVDSAGRLYIESKTDNLLTGKGLIVSEDGIYRSIQGANVSGMWNNKSLIFDAGNISGSKVTTNDVSGGLNITSITQSAYDELQDKDANTLYIITE